MELQLEPKPGAIFLFLFSISKERAVVNSNFPAGRGKGNFLCLWKNGTPWPPEDSSSQEHLFALIEASPNGVLGIRRLLFKWPTVLQYLFPTCLMATIAWECSSRGKLFRGPDTAELTAANAHPGAGLHPAAWAKKCLFLSTVYQAQPKFLRKGRQVIFHPHTSMLQNQVVSFTFCLLSLSFWGFPFLVVLNSCHMLKMRIGKLISPTRELLKSRR